MMKHTPARNGYTLLLTVLVVGVMASATSVALVLLGLSVERSAYSMQLSAQAFQGAWTCMENAVASLQADLEYEGNVTRSFVYAYDNKGTIQYDLAECTIYPIGGEGNEDRTICAEATFGNFTKRRLEAHLERVIPGAVVDSWKEVAAIQSCQPFTGPPPEDCGNGTVDWGEECDDGNTRNNDGCSSVCRNEVCGDGIQQAGEQCDDGNTESGDGCNELCESEVCGDGILAANEECDDGNTANNDGCSSSCRIERCGDGVLQTNEECDDGNTDVGDGCSELCQIEIVVTPSPGDYIGYWKLDETSVGATVVDETGNSHDGTPKNGAAISTGDKASLAFGNTASRDFDGWNDYIDFTDSSFLFPTPITVSFWTKNDSAPWPFDGIICKTDSTIWSKGWGFFYNSSSEITFFIQEWDDNYARSQINPTSWNHVAGIYDGSAIRIYVNGILGSRSDTYSGPLNRGRKLTMGRCGDRDWADAFNIDGKLDDVRIYNRVLSQSEIAALASGN